MNPGRPGEYARTGDHFVRRHDVVKRQVVRPHRQRFLGQLQRVHGRHDRRVRRDLRAVAEQRELEVRVAAPLPDAAAVCGNYDRPADDKVDRAYVFREDRSPVLEGALNTCRPSSLGTEGLRIKLYETALLTECGTAM